MHGKSAWLRLSPLLCFPLLYGHYVNCFLLVKMEEDHCSTITELGKNTGVFICYKGQNKTQPRISRFCLPGIHLFFFSSKITHMWGENHHFSNLIQVRIVTSGLSLWFRLADQRFKFLSHCDWFRKCTCSKLGQWNKSGDFYRLVGKRKNYLEQELPELLHGDNIQKETWSEIWQREMGR